ncbi:hypothetical protein [Herbaspirillum rhizosphaerae]|uniref:hypothetical protein n=1 Tax=Herbaspirillum rhizosphaerae TaxID=346179 RepID=UPI00067D1835|nr:hypothetical protein [Herbaspirillum rhizosphaerae]
MKANKQLRRAAMASMAIALAAICMATNTRATENTQQAATSALPAYAPVKEKICTDCKISIPPEMIPRRGVVLSNGSFSTPAGYWEAVDIDQRKMTRFITQLNTETHKLAVVQSRTVPLSDDDVAELIGLANAVWRFPDKLPSTSANDVVWGVDLFDGAVTRKEYGVGLVQGDGANLEAALEQVWRRLAR